MDRHNENKWVLVWVILFLISSQINCLAAEVEK
jgi:hypothetical protein